MKGLTLDTERARKITDIKSGIRGVDGDKRSLLCAGA